MPVRTAPTVTGSPTSIAVSVRMIDASGDERSVRLIVPPTATDIEIESYVARLQAASNASVWEVQIQNLYTGAKLASNATNAVSASVFNNIVLLLKLNTLTSQNAYVPAPISALVPSGDKVDITNQTYIDWRDDTLTMLGGNYSAQSVRFTERREKNDATPA